MHPARLFCPRPRVGCIAQLPRPALSNLIGLDGVIASHPIHCLLSLLSHPHYSPYSKHNKKGLSPLPPSESAYLNSSFPATHRTMSHQNRAGKLMFSIWNHSRWASILSDIDLGSCLCQILGESQLIMRREVNCCRMEGWL